MARILGLLGAAVMALVLIALFATGVLPPDDDAGSGDGTDVVALLERVCPEGGQIDEGSPDGDFVEDFGEPDEYALCTVEGSDIEVEAFVVEEDPGSELVNTADEWESGTGGPVSYAVKETEDRYVVVLSVNSYDDERELLQFEEDGFEVQGNMSSGVNE